MDSQDLRNLSEAYNNVYETIGTAKPQSQYSTKPGDGKPYKDGPLWGGPDDKPTPTAPKPATPTASTSLKPRNDVRNRDVSARGGFDPRFDRRPKQTTGGTVKTPTPTTAPKPTGPVAQAPKPNVGGVLGQLDKMARRTAGDIGGRIGEREGRNRTGNLPVISDIGGAIGRNKGREQGQKTYDNLKNTATQALGGLLKQDYEFDNFDIILEYLVAEGYADTNENALVIMANMSEEWKETILEAEVLAQKGGVPGSVKVRPSISIPGTNIGVGPNKPVPGTFTTTTPGQREKIKQGDTQIDTGVGGMKPREGAGPTSSERQRYNRQAIRTGARPMAQ